MMLISSIECKGLKGSGCFSCFSSKTDDNEPAATSNTASANPNTAAANPSEAIITIQASDIPIIPPASIPEISGSQSLTSQPETEQNGSPSECTEQNGNTIECTGQCNGCTDSLKN